jgi:AraC-like DNA-binding protein
MTFPPRPGRADPGPPERILYASRDVRVGVFNCPVDHPDFRTAGPIEGYTVCFPRTAVWIEHAGKPPFVADPGVVTIYNRGQPYVRRALAPDGDRGDWYSVGRELAVAIANAIEPEVDPTRPFPVSFTRSTARLYYRQRVLSARIRRGEIDPFEIEQEVAELIGAALERAVRPGPEPERVPVDSRELVERTRAALAGNPFESITVRQLAQRVGVSPFHLCRRFRRETGLTLHQYLLELRIRSALERVEGAPADLSRVAHQLGFSSHSHFTAAFRIRLGVTPSEARDRLAGTARGTRAIA